MAGGIALAAADAVVGENRAAQGSQGGAAPVLLIPDHVHTGQQPALADQVGQRLLIDDVAASGVDDDAALGKQLEQLAVWSLRPQ